MSITIDSLKPIKEIIGNTINNKYGIEIRKIESKEDFINENIVVALNLNGEGCLKLISKRY